MSHCALIRAMKTVWVIFGFLACVFGWSQMVIPPSIPAKLLSKPPVIDGVVEAGEWEEAYTTQEFWSPTRQQPAPFSTRVAVGYTREAIYVAFECVDPEPHLIRAQVTRRGSGMEQDDHVAVVVDPQNQGTDAYWFRVNPLGTQAEQIPGGSSQNIRWRGDWQARAHLHESGWSVEVRIPFAILRYSAEQTQFGIAFVRWVPRLQEQFVFPNTGQVFNTRRLTVWEGVRVPAPRRPLVLMPYVLGGTGSGTRYSQGGFDVKYVAENGISLVGTFQPDLENIASAVTSIDFTYEERALDETRPFFQEGRWFFPWRRFFHTPRVPDIDWGLKAFGTTGRWAFGVLGAEYASRSVGQHFTVGRVRYQLAPQTFLGLQGLYDQRRNAPERLWGIDLNQRWITSKGDWNLGVYYYRLQSARNGHYAVVRLDRSAPIRQISWTIDYTEISADYRPRLAFVPVSDYREWDLEARYEDKPSGGAFLKWEVGVEGSFRRRFSGALLDESLSLSAQGLLRNHMEFGVRLTRLQRPTHLDQTISLQVRWRTLDIYRTGQVQLLVGNQNKGRSQYWFAEQKLEILPRLRLEARWESLLIDYPQRPDDRAKQLLLTLNYEITPERGLGGRYIAYSSSQSGRTQRINNFFLTYFQRLRNGQELYVIWGVPAAERTQNRLAVKLLTPLDLVL